MAAVGEIGFVSAFRPGVPGGTSNEQAYGSAQTCRVAATSETVAQIICDPTNYAGGGTDPEWTFELEGGSDDDISPGTLTGAAWRIIQKVTGQDNDFTTVRGLHIAAEPLVAGTAVVVKAVLSMGDLTGTALERMALPILLESATDTDSSDFCGAAVAMPNGFTFDVSDPLRLRVYECSNARIIITLLGD